ncbi:MAG: C39 family peptidase [Patescibacteria group bacterium]|nr:C39 family peptidase [Patescibacteria group bacterium]
MKNLIKKSSKKYVIFFIIFLFIGFNFKTNLSRANNDNWTMPDYTWEVEDIGKIDDAEVDPAIRQGTYNPNEKGKTPDLNPLGNLQIKIPGLDEIAAKHPIKCEGEEENQVCKIPWIAIYIHAIYNYLLGIGGVLAAIVLMVAGVLWLVSAGNASRVTQAKNLITGSITGLLILFTSYIILYQINPNLIGLKYIELETIDFYDIPEEAQILAPSAGPSNHGVPLYYQCSDSGKKILYHSKNSKCPDLKDYIKIYGTQASPIGNYKGSPNLCTSGCGILSTFMAVNKFKSEQNLEKFTRTGESLGARGASCNGSTASGLILLAKSYGLSAGSTNGTNDIIKKIDEGCVVVISLKNSGENCSFTNGGHFITLTGWREKNNLIVDVNDPQGNTAYPYKGQCSGEKLGNPTPCKTWLSLNNWGGCSLNQQFYICNK